MPSLSFKEVAFHCEKRLYTCTEFHTLKWYFMFDIMVVLGGERVRMIASLQTSVIPPNQINIPNHSHCVDFTVQQVRRLLEALLLQLSE